ncbi:MAG: hypothetical protein LBK42_11080 [Propionibacteriaceae bacterium]|jgi:hypothetical protein|nr:hypothetical protein [Propionibacteriaceae bacterium]
MSVHTRRRLVGPAAVVLALLIGSLLSGCAVDQQIVGSWRLEHNQDYFYLDTPADPYLSATGLVFGDNGKASVLIYGNAAGEDVLRYKTRDGHIEVTYEGEVVQTVDGVPLSGTYWFNNEALFISLDTTDVELIFFRLP